MPFVLSSWRHGPPLPTPMQDAAIVQFGNTFLAVGGDSQFYGELRTVLEFDPISEDWITREDKLVEGRARYPCATLMNKDVMGC